MAKKLGLRIRNEVKRNNVISNNVDIEYIVIFLGKKKIVYITLNP